jgi:DNA sulfur modification protein DndB
MKSNVVHSFPVIRGVQAGREFYISMCPLRLLPSLFSADVQTSDAEDRSQRTLNRARLPKIARYILENRDSYVMSSLTVSIDGTPWFEALKSEDEASFRQGTLHIPKGSKVNINEGQHRRAGLEMAMKVNPELEYETIAVVFFRDRGLARGQQIFADLNHYAIRPSTSLSLLYDHRNIKANLSRQLSFESPVFQGLVETERSTLSPSSSKLFSFSGLYFSISEIFPEKEIADFQKALEWSQEFWDEIALHIPEWKYVRDSKMTAIEVRKNFIHSHGIILQALGRVGHSLLGQSKGVLTDALDGLDQIDWSRNNVRAWEGRAMVGGRVVKSFQNVILTANYIKKKCGIPVSSEEQLSEDVFWKSRQADGVVSVELSHAK